MLWVESSSCMEHPEQLGMASGLVPASIWDWAEFKQLQTGLVQGAIFQCVFGAPSSKPTRLASNGNEEFEKSPLGAFPGPPVLNAEGGYLGPLPDKCPHGGHQHKLIGKAEDGSWKTGPAAAYPPGLCEEMAKFLVQHLLKHPKAGLGSGAGEEGQLGGTQSSYPTEGPGGQTL